jgi:hypothetical protein
LTIRSTFITGDGGSLGDFAHANFNIKILEGGLDQCAAICNLLFRIEGKGAFGGVLEKINGWKAVGSGRSGDGNWTTRRLRFGRADDFVFRFFLRLLNDLLFRRRIRLVFFPGFGR